LKKQVPIRCELKIPVVCRRRLEADMKAGDAKFISEEDGGKHLFQL